MKKEKETDGLTGSREIEEEVPRSRKGRRNLWAPDVFIHALGPLPE
jgi:hypothetical protein